MRYGSRGQGYYLFGKPVGPNLSKKQTKEILKREKKKYQWIRTDKVEDPYNQGHDKADHYLRNEQQARIDYQKYQLCKGKTFRVS